MAAGCVLGNFTTIWHFFTNPLPQSEGIRGLCGDFKANTKQWQSPIFCGLCQGLRKLRMLGACRARLLSGSANVVEFAMTQPERRAHENLPDHAFKALYDIVTRLRGPGGCPWDREQDSFSLRGNLIEETYECIEAIDEKDPAHTKEELGDIFLVATMIAYFHEEDGLFTVADALQTVCEKLVRRHPHVFGEAKARDASEVLDNWAKIKVEQEGRSPKDSAMDEVSAALPPLDRAWKLQKKAAKAGFDWPSAEGASAKITEELGEALEAAKSGAREKIEEELGDLLFAVVNLCRHFKVEPSVALRKTNSKFAKRFRHVEKRMRETGQEMRPGNLSAMDRFWDEAKGGLS